MPLRTESPRMQNSPWGGVLLAKNLASTTSKVTGRPTDSYLISSGVQVEE